MDNHNTSLFTKTMSFVVVSLGIFLRVYAFCINPTQGLYTPLPVDMTDTIRISTEEPQKDAEYVPGEIIVKFKPTQVNLKTFAGQRSVQNFAAEQDLLPTDSVANANLVLLEVDDSMSIEQKIRELESDPTVEYAEPNYVRHLLSTVNDYNDTYADQMWGLTKIQWPNAMDVLDTYPSLTDILVAVIDVGVAYDHPDLVNQMRDGSDCKSYTGVTIAGGCVHGYDFYDNDNDPYPRNFSIHGTHVAGTIAAQINNATGIMGVNPHTKIMAIRAGDTNYLDSFAIIKGVQFATQNHAKVINASYGGTGYSTSEYNAINNFGLSGGLFIAAAGNNGRNNEIPANHSYPSDYNLPNILSVAATTDTDDLASFSNYGSTSVDVGAPGYSILSTIISSGVMFTENFSSSFTEKRIATGTNPSRGIIGGQLYGDVNRSPYTANSDTTITLISGIDLSSLHDATIAWYTQCDTELSAPSANSDYMALEYSSDGTTFTELGKRNELTLRNTNRFGDNYITYLFNPPSSNLTSTFSLRFRRHSDNDDNNYIGCLIDDIRILYPVGAYKSLPGTSMATPHVVGLASMLRSANSGLSYTQIKNIIMSSGDSLSALSGKTVSGKRINMYASLAALGLPSSAPNRGDVYSSLSNLLSGQGIHNNLNSVTSSGITNVSGLYFAVRDASRELGKITFTTGIDLSNSDTQYFISGYLADALDIELGHIAFTPAAGFINQPATITLYIDQVASGFLSTLTRDSFAVTTSENESLDPKEIISTVTTGTCTNGLCPIYLAVEHFTAFDIRPILHTVHIASNNSFSSLLAQNGDEITITFSSLETLTPEPIAIINDKIFSGNDLSGQVDRSVSFIVGTDVSIDDGEIAFTLSYMDSNGNTGAIVNRSTDNSFVIVSNSPSSPSTPTITSMVSLTRTDTVTLTGTTSAHALVTLFDHGERDQVVTQGFSDRDGRFSIVAPLTEGTHELQAYATNIAQELSNDSNILTITRDSTPPIMTGTSLVGTPIVSGGYYATGVSFNFSGSDISGATLNGTPYTSDTPILVEGAYTFVLQDIAGNTSSLSFTLDFTAPTFLGAEDNHIYNHTLIITGTDNFAFSGFELNNIFSLDMIISIDTDGTYTLTGYDRAGNSSALHFSIDQVAPTITGTTLVGTPVISGGYYATGVSFSFSGSNISGATLNGTPYTSDTPILVEGAYTFVLQDIAGNTSSLSFTLDFTAPTFLGAEDNHIYNHTLIITGTDNFAFSGFELNNIFSLDMIISIDTDGTYTLTGYDRAGNSSALHFSIDQVAPTITGTTLVGTPVISGGYYATGVSFSFSGSNISGATLNGNVYTSNTPIITEGAYTFVLQDIAGNISSLSFTLDFTAPTFLGAEDNHIYNHSLIITGTDNFAFSGFELNNIFSLDMIISIDTDGTYTLTGYDRAGNSSSLHFSIDQVAPTITGTTLVGTPVISGGYYATGVSFSFSGSDISGATLNGTAYTSDAPILVEGAYTFVLQDIAGNTSSLSFTLDFTAPLITPEAPASGSQILYTNIVHFVWSGSDNQAISGYIIVLTGIDDTITYTTTDDTYRATLNSGSYTRYITAVDRANNSRTSSGSTFTLNSEVTTSITLLTGNLYHHTSRYTKDYANILITTTAPATYSITGDFTTSPLNGSLTNRFTGSLILTAPDGEKSIFVQTTNEFFSTGKNFSLILDTTAPSVPLLTSAGSGTTLSGTFTLDRSDAIDSGAGISGYQYIISSISGTQTTGILLSGFTSSSSVSISNGTLASGVYYRYVKAIDMLGNFTFSSIGSFGYSGSIDMIPDQFTFEDITDADLNESYLSEPVTITGLSINTPVLASISKGVLYIRGEMVGTTGYVQNGRDVQIELISRNAYDSVVSSKLTIGGVSDTFSITTKEADDVSDTLSKAQKLQVVAIFQVLQDLYQGAKAKEFLESLLLMIENQMDDYDDDELEYITLSYLYDLVEDYYDDAFDSNTNNDIDTVSWIVNGVYTAPNGKKYTITYDSKKQQFTSTNFITPKYFPTLDVLKYTIDMSNPVGSAYANAKTIKARWGKVAIDGTRQTSAYTAPNRKVFYFFKTMAGKYSSYTFSSEKYFDSLEATKAHIYANNPK